MENKIIKTIWLKGDDEDSINRRFIYLKRLYKNKGYEVILIDKNNTGNIKDIFKEQSLFENKRLIIVKGNVNQKIFSRFIKIDHTEEYNISKSIFKLIDLFNPGQIVAFRKYLDVIIKEEPLELVFTLLVKHIRDLIWIKMDKSSINYPEWRLKKLNTHANYFDFNTLKKIIKDFSEMDIKYKTSGDELLSLLDHSLIRQLEL